jgi:hypothetical protein
MGWPTFEKACRSRQTAKALPRAQGSPAAAARRLSSAHHPSRHRCSLQRVCIAPLSRRRGQKGALQTLKQSSLPARTQTPNRHASPPPTSAHQAGTRPGAAHLAPAHYHPSRRLGTVTCRTRCFCRQGNHCPPSTARVASTPGPKSTPYAEPSRRSQPSPLRCIALHCDPRPRRRGPRQPMPAWRLINPGNSPCSIDDSSYARLGGVHASSAKSPTCPYTSLTYTPSLTLSTRHTRLLRRPGFFHPSLPIPAALHSSKVTSQTTQRALYLLLHTYLLLISPVSQPLSSWPVSMQA